MTPTQPQLDLAELRRLAEAATPGPWIVGPESRHGFGVIRSPQHGLVADAGPFHWEENAAYIAAANPATILRLLDLLEDTDEVLELIEAEQRAALAAPSQERASEPAGLDVLRTRRVLCEMEHEIRHPGNGVAESCIECLRAADGLIADLTASAATQERP